MNITVKSFADLRELIESEVQLDVSEGETIGGILLTLCAAHPGLREALFEPSGTLRDYINVLKNGRNIAFLDGLATQVSSGDSIALFPPAAGG